MHLPIAFQLRHRSEARSRLNGGKAWLLCLMLAGAPASSQIVINEVLANNKGVLTQEGVTPDYVELYNAGSQPFSVAGMRLTDDPAQPAKFVFPAGTVLEAGGHLLVLCTTNPLASGLRANFGLSSSGDLLRLYAADGATLVDAVVFGLQVPNLSVGRVPDGAGAWQLNQPSPREPNEAQPLAPPAGLRINEWMARPATGDDWLELYNSASLPVSLTGLVLTDRPVGTPTNRALLALSFVGARGFAKFQATDLEQADADHLDFKLGSSGETLTLYAADRSTIIDRVTFGSQVPNVAQGRAPDGSANIVSFPPGFATPDEPNMALITNVVISEVLSHTDPPLEDAIELHNPTAAPVDISHWWLSDSAAEPKKYRIPAGTVIPAGGYWVCYEYQFGASGGFSLDSAEGDEVYLSAGDATGKLTGSQLWANFGALKNGISAGRVPTSLGTDFVPLRERTFGVDNPSAITQFRTGTGRPNAGPRVGPVVISEIHFQPPASVTSADEEFVELHNPTANPVALYDPLHPTNRWRIRDGVSFDLPANTTLAAGGYLVLVSFDPVTAPSKLAAFRAKFGVPAQVPVLGPYEGKLSDAGETLKLLWPDKPEGPAEPNPGYVPYELVEMVKYQPGPPWPSGAAGTGQSLQRRDALSYGNEPLNWYVGAPTAGQANVADSDGDGMPDDWEIAHGLAPYSRGDADLDLDGDGMSNRAEFLAGTDPRNQQSALRLGAARAVDHGLQVSFSGVTGRSYTIERRGLALTDPWQAVTNLALAADSGPVLVTLPMRPDGAIYRVTLSGQP